MPVHESLLLWVLVIGHYFRSQELAIVNRNHSLLIIVVIFIKSFDCNNKFDMYYYGQVNSLRLKSSLASKWQVNTSGDTIYFAVDSTYSINFSCCLNKLCRKNIGTIKKIAISLTFKCIVWYWSINKIWNYSDK